MPCPTSPTSRSRSTRARRATRRSKSSSASRFPIETAMGGLPKPRIHAVALALRPEPGHRRLQGRHRHLLRAPARQRAHPAGEGPAAGRHRDRDGAGLDRPRRNLHVHRRGRGRARKAPGGSALHADATCARSRTGSSGRSCAPCPASSRSTPIGGYEKQFHVLPDPGAADGLQARLPRRHDGAGGQQRQCRRRLHRAQRRAISRPRAGPGREHRRDPATS